MHTFVGSNLCHYSSDLPVGSLSKHHARVSSRNNSKKLRKYIPGEPKESSQESNSSGGLEFEFLKIYLEVKN